MACSCRRGGAARESRPVVRLQVREATPNGSPPAGAGLLGADALVDFDWQVAAGGAILDKAEFERLVALKTPLVSVKGRWVEFRPGEVEAALRFWTAQAASGPKRLSQVARLALGGDGAAAQAGLPLDPDAPVEASPAVAAALAALGDPTPRPTCRRRPACRPRCAPTSCAATPGWRSCGACGLGACLADDMGLGKTIQTLALLLHWDRGGAGPALLVCPTSVVGNWQREVGALRARPARAGPPRRRTARRARRSRRPPAPHDLVLTSYALLRRDEATLASRRLGRRGARRGAEHQEPATPSRPAAAQRLARRLPARADRHAGREPPRASSGRSWSSSTPATWARRTDFRARFALPIERERDPRPPARLQAAASAPSSCAGSRPTARSSPTCPRRWR